jgi:hypothetical protein
MWPTATAEDAESSQARREKDVTLTEAAKLWPTPRRQEGESGPDYARQGREGSGGTDLTTFVAEQWQTPASDIFRSRGGDRVDEQGLDQQARLWATPQAQDAKQEGDRPHSRSIMLIQQVSRFSLPDLTTTPPGSESSESAPSLRQRRKLNPTFVCWLMNWPTWWTSLEPRNCDLQEMESYLSKQRMLLRHFVGDSSDLRMSTAVAELKQPHWTSLAPLGSGSRETE